MQGRLTIGDFSRVTHLSIRTLRRYHESGLLEPADVDEWTGYRYYATTQIPTAQTIRRFRDLGMPVREVGELLQAPPDERDALIARHLERLEAELTRTQDAVRSLRRLLDGGAAALDVERRHEPARTVAAVSAVVDLPDVLDCYAGAMAELRAAVVRPTGPPGGLYDNELFTEERGELVVFLPTSDPSSTGRVHAVELAAVDLAVTVHHGGHHDIDVTYGALGSWVDAHGLAVAGPVHETYLVGPDDTTDERAWRTEIGWPVADVSREAVPRRGR